MRFLVSILFGFLAFSFYSCEEGSDDIDITQYEPFVTIGFYNAIDEKVVTPIDQVTPSVGTAFSFETDAATYKLPLDINSDKSEFTITIAGIDGILNLEYVPRVENQVNILRFLMEEVTVVNHSYDSVKVICESNCLSNETEIKIYR